MSNTADVPKKWENGKSAWLTHGTRKPNKAFRSASTFVAIYVEIVVYGRVVMNVRAVASVKIYVLTEKKICVVGTWCEKAER